MSLSESECQEAVILLPIPLPFLLPSFKKKGQPLLNPAYLDSENSFIIIPFTKIGSTLINDPKK